ncbi:MAG: hypothetical protein KDD42_04820 [Bdellovibrionales bacterium]|nr:hypothetical protein [Bdellovibrionales bacterium]
MAIEFDTRILPEEVVKPDSTLDNVTMSTELAVPEAPADSILEKSLNATKNASPETIARIEKLSNLTGSELVEGIRKLLMDELREGMVTNGTDREDVREIAKFAAERGVTSDLDNRINAESGGKHDLKGIIKEEFGNPREAKALIDTFYGINPERQAEEINSVITLEYRLSADEIQYLEELIGQTLDAGGAFEAEVLSKIRTDKFAEKIRATLVDQDQEGVLNPPQIEKFKTLTDIAAGAGILDDVVEEIGVSGLSSAVAQLSQQNRISFSDGINLVQETLIKADLGFDHAMHANAMRTALNELRDVTQYDSLLKQASERFELDNTLSFYTKELFAQDLTSAIEAGVMTTDSALELARENVGAVPELYAATIKHSLANGNFADLPVIMSEIHGAESIGHAEIRSETVEAAGGTEAMMSAIRAAQQNVGGDSFTPLEADHLIRALCGANPVVHAEALLSAFDDALNDRDNSREYGLDRLQRYLGRDGEEALPSAQIEAVEDILNSNGIAGIDGMLDQLQDERIINSEFRNGIDKRLVDAQVERDLATRAQQAAEEEAAMLQETKPDEALPEVQPASKRYQFTLNEGEYVSHYAKDILIAEGNPAPTREEVVELSARILASKGLSMQDATKLRPGTTFEFELDMPKTTTDVAER